MSQKLHLNTFKWIEEATWYKEDFIKDYNDNNNEGYFFEVDVQYTKDFHNLHNDLPFLSELMNFEKHEKLEQNCMEKND